MKQEPKGRVSGTLIVLLGPLVLIGMVASLDRAWTFAIVVFASVGVVIMVALRDGED